MTIKSLLENLSYTVKDKRILCVYDPVGSKLLYRVDMGKDEVYKELLNKEICDWYITEDVVVVYAL